MEQLMMIRYGELGTKGKNQKVFINLLAHNIRRAFKSFTNVKVDSKKDHSYLTYDDSEEDKIIQILQGISGIYSFSKVYRVDNEFELIQAKALEIAKNSKVTTFKMITKRVEKRFPMHSSEINREIAGVILNQTSLKVDVHHPELALNIVIRPEGTYLYDLSILGAGGYPLGSQGKALMMLSGGIDSPVASYKLLRRGIKIEALHFAAPPYTSTSVITKITDILHVLNTYQEKILLSIVPFTKIQEKIYEVAGDEYAITIMRRMMYRIACKVAYKRHCQAVANGESIGQVASQTLDSILAIEKVATMPILRPLSTVDKLDIIKDAKKLGTYEISIRPFEDCCTIFDPKNPTTRPHMDKIEAFESRFDYETMIDEAIEGIERTKISLDEELI